MFAKLHLKMDLEVLDECVTMISKRPLHTPVPAVSVSPRMVYFLASIAGNLMLNAYMRFYAAAFVVMALAALRGIDAQRSRFDADHGHYFSSVAWDSKKKRPMPWACPKKAFGFDIYTALMAGWQARDYLFVVVTASLDPLPKNGQLRIGRIWLPR